MKNEGQNKHPNAPEKERKNWEKNNKIKKHACKQVRAVCTHMTKKIFENFFLKINLFEKKFRFSFCAWSACTCMHAYMRLCVSLNLP